MATLFATSQQIFTIDGVHFSVSKVKIATSSDTFTAPTSVEAVSALKPTGTATATVTASGATVTIASGTVGADYYVVCKHFGHAAGVT